MRRTIPRAVTIAATCALAFATLCGSAGAGANAPPVTTTLAVRGAILAIDSGYVIFTSGDALRLRAGTPVPEGTRLGSVVVATIDRLARDVTALARESSAVTGEIAISELPREYVVVAPKSARTIEPTTIAAGIGSSPEGVRVGATPELARVRTTVTLEVTVPSNTPPNDDVYVSTDRSNYGPAEIRMQRVDSRRFVATVALDANGRLKYQYTRGTYATVERDRSGGIVRPHEVDRGIDKTDDVVTRWADVN